MTWGEIKLIALQTMFSNEGQALAVDDINQEYLYAMPGKANEAMQQIAAVGRPILKEWHITVAEGAGETETEDMLTLPAVEKRYRIRMRHYLPRFRCIDRGAVMLDDGVCYDVAEDWSVEGDDVLVLPGSVTGVYTVWYRAYPQTIAADTPDDAVIDMPEDAAVLIPLYIAAELYKEDELAMATVLRNEYEDGLQKVQAAWQSSAGGMRVESARNTTGWW